MAHKKRDAIEMPHSNGIEVAQPTSPRANLERSSPIALVCTLGGKPQVATFALDALIAQGVAVSRLHVLHLSAADRRIKASVDSLRAEVRIAYSARGITFESNPIQPVRTLASDGVHPVFGAAIERIDDPAAPDAIWMTAQALIKRLKNEGFVTHLCVTGGPRLVALQTLSAASLMLGVGDECWHLYTPPGLREEAGEGAILHAPAGQTRLVRVPLLPLGALAPGLRTMAFASPADVIAAGERRLSQEQIRRCEAVKATLTAREWDVLKVFAISARTHAEAAKILRLSESTLRTHMKKLLAVCREEWGDAPEAKLNHHVLRERFGDLPPAFWG